MQTNSEKIQQSSSRSVAESVKPSYGNSLPAVSVIKEDETNFSQVPSSGTTERPLLQTKSEVFANIGSNQPGFTAQFQNAVIQRVELPANKEEIETYLAKVRELKAEDRQRLLADPEYMQKIKWHEELSNGEKTMLVGGLMEGSFKWKQAGGETNTDFGKHFGEKDEKADPANNRQNATMNCWEAILYAAHQAGLYDEEDLKAFQDLSQKKKAKIITPTKNLKNTDYSEAISEPFKLRLNAIDDQEDKKPLDAKEKADMETELKSNLKLDDSGKMAVYQQGGKDSHWTLTLGGNKVMSLNGEGQSVGIFPAGDLNNLLPPFWSNDNDRAIAQTILMDGIKHGDPPWEEE